MTPKAAAGPAARAAAAALAGPLDRWAQIVRRTMYAGCGCFVALVACAAAMLGVSGGQPQPDSGANTADIPSAVLAAYTNAADDTDIPWPILAGIGATQTNHGRTAPGETIQREQPDPTRPATTTTGGAVQTRLSPELVPPITTPGYGLYLIDGPTIVANPQHLDAASHAIAERLAQLVEAGARAANLDDDTIVGVFNTDTTNIPPRVWRVWVEAINNLPLTPAPDAAGAGSLGEAAMSRAARYAGYTPPETLAGPVGDVGATVPYATAFNTAGATTGIDPRMLAAVAQVESGFDLAVVSCEVTSPTGAEGVMQLEPGTAASLHVDPCDPAAAIAAAAQQLRGLHDRFGTWPIAWAAYNAGEGAVLRYGGIPPYPETRSYVQRVQAAWDQLRAQYPTPTVTPDASAAGCAPTGDTPGDAAIRAACTQLGVAYMWGGETAGQAMDCSGLTQWAWRQAGIAIARVTWDQMRDGTPIPNLEAAQPGDLLFFEGGAHVALYLGNSQMIHAPHTGDVVRIGPVYAPPFVIRRPA
ncbi:MAG TPA: NlpC/P60 family protein [Acidimicrobiales bacterium]|jgi:cell wall-associated NlpC family hydrolase|nr:NlpC/P60 family protein [Acidimicrobiales bacterium]